MAEHTLLFDGTLNVMNNTRSSVLANGTLHLFQSNTIPSPDMNTANITEADYSGYGNIAVPIWDLPQTVLGGTLEMQTPKVTFNHDGGPDSNVIYGFYFKDSGGRILLVGRFDDSQPMGAVTDAIDLVVTWVQPYDTGGRAIVID